MLSLITLIMKFNYYDSLELLYKTQRNWHVWKKLSDSAVFSCIKILPTSASSMYQAQAII